jgi:hypothetical protein
MLTTRPPKPLENPVPIVQEPGWAPGPVWTCAKNLSPTGIRSPVRPARSPSLYRLSYPAHKYKVDSYKITVNRTDDEYCCLLVLLSFKPTYQQAAINSHFYMYAGWFYCHGELQVHGHDIFKITAHKLYCSTHCVLNASQQFLYTLETDMFSVCCIQL